MGQSKCALFYPKWVVLGLIIKQRLINQIGKKSSNHGRLNQPEIIHQKFFTLNTAIHGYIAKVRQIWIINWVYIDGSRAVVV